MKATQLQPRSREALECSIDRNALLCIICHCFIRFEMNNHSPDFGIENIYIIYSICHIASMTSAITNPILYGFMNENFRQEFAKIFGQCVSFTGLRQLFTNHHNSNNHNIPQPTQMAERQTKTENRHDEDMV